MPFVCTIELHLHSVIEIVICCSSFGSYAHVYFYFFYGSIHANKDDYQTKVQLRCGNVFRKFFRNNERDNLQSRKVSKRLRRFKECRREKSKIFYFPINSKILHRCLIVNRLDKAK